MTPQAPQKLSAHSANLERILDSAQDAVFALDHSGNVVFWNPEAERIFGYTQEEAMGAELASLIVPKQYRRFFNKQLEQFKTRGDGPFFDRRLQLRCKRKNGEFFFAEATTSPLISGNDVVGMSCFFRDITHLRAANKTHKKLTGELQIQEANYRALIDSSIDAIVAVDHTGCITIWNGSAVQMFGRSEEEALGSPLKEILIPSRYHKAFDRTVGYLLTQKAFSSTNRRFRLKAAHKDGTEMMIDCSASYYEYENQFGLCWIGRDITQDLEDQRRRKHLTEALKKSNVELMQSNEALEQFAYAASHDLQTPLRGISGCATLLKIKHEHLLDETTKDLVSRIIGSCHQMKTMIGDILNFSRIESQSQTFKQVDLNEVVDSALEFLAPSIEETKAEIIRSTLPTVLGDRGQLTQLFQNIIGNGIKYCDKPQPTIIMGGEPVENYFRVSIADNGIGIPSEYFDRIFEVFRRLHTSEEYPGTGIGLAICRRIVRRHGGQLGLTSTPGEGSTFYFTLKTQ